MDDFWDDLNLTAEEAMLYMGATRARIKKLEAKARRRLSMTDEEKILFRNFRRMQNNPELKELIITLIVAVS